LNFIKETQREHSEQLFAFAIGPENGFGIVIGLYNLARKSIV